jgi:serine/threonine protein kinase
VLDFGIAHIEKAPGDAPAGRTMGTLAYMSPEQARGESIDQRTDMWALGVVLYEMATGAHPFAGENARAVREAIQTIDPDPIDTRRPDLPIELSDLIRKMLVKAAPQRYGSMAELASEL